MSLKVLLVGNYVPDGQKSMQRFASMMKRELEERGHRVRLLRPRPRFNRPSAPPPGRSKWLGYVDKMFLFGPSLRQGARWADVVHICDHSNAFYTRALKHVPHLVTCHDVLAIRSALGHFPANPSGPTGRLLQSLILRTLKQVPFVACDSQATREQLMQLGYKPSTSTCIIHVGLNYPYSPMTPEEARPLLRQISERGAPSSQRPGRLPQVPEQVLGEDEAGPRFVLHVGSDSWYKNREGVLKIYAALRRALPSAPPLVMAGAPLSVEARAFVNANGLSSYVFEAPGISNEEMRALYSSSCALLFPSLAEGFGWPIIEAQASGCPVFTSDRAPMTEVGGPAAAYFDPEQPEQAASLLASHLASPVHLQAMRESGMQNVRRFDAGTMCERYIEVYKSVLADHASQPSNILGHRKQGQFEGGPRA